MKRYLSCGEFEKNFETQRELMNERVTLFFVYIKNKKTIPLKYQSRNYYLTLSDYDKMTIDNKINFKYIYQSQRNEPYLFNQFELPF